MPADPFISYMEIAMSDTSSKKPVLTEQHVADIKKKLDEMKGKELTKGEKIKLNTDPAAMWSVNYST